MCYQDRQKFFCLFLSKRCVVLYHSRVILGPFLTGHDMWEDVFAQCIKCCECGANKSCNIESNLCLQLVKPCYERRFRDRAAEHTHALEELTTVNIFLLFTTYTHKHNEM